MDFFHADYIVFIVRVIVPEMSEDFDFDLSLVFELFRVFDDFYSDNLLFLVVEGFDALAKGSAA
jgi:hypothetical protein